MDQNVNKQEEIHAMVVMETVKLIVDSTPNDMELGEKIRQVFKHVEVISK